MVAAQRIALAFALAAASAAPYAAGPGQDNDTDPATAMSDTNSRVIRGREIVPPGVVLNLKGKQRGLVWQGSYIVNTSGCIDCHTHPTYSPGGDPFQGQPERVNAERQRAHARVEHDEVIAEPVHLAERDRRGLHGGSFALVPPI